MSELVKQLEEALAEDPGRSFAQMRAELRAIAQIRNPKAAAASQTEITLSRINVEPGEPDDYRLTVSSLHLAQREAIRAWMGKYGLAPYDHEQKGTRWDWKDIYFLTDRSQVKNPDRFMHLL